MAEQDPGADGEHLVMLLHPHWTVLIRPVLAAVAVAAAALLLEAVLPAGRAAAAGRLAVAAAALLVLMAWLMVPVLRWRLTTYELTTRRLRLRAGIVARHGRDIPLAGIDEVSFGQGPLGRLLRAGRLVVEPAAGPGAIVLAGVPRVQAVHAAVLRLADAERRRLGRGGTVRP